MVIWQQPFGVTASRTFRCYRMKVPGRHTRCVFSLTTVLLQLWRALATELGASFWLNFNCLLLAHLHPSRHTN